MNATRLNDEQIAILTTSSADDELNEAQLAIFKGLLEARRAELREAFSQSRNESNESLTAADPVDRATLESEFAAILNNREAMVLELERIAAALARIEAGEFGYCEMTGARIPMARLMAIPTTQFTVEAQAMNEFHERMRAA